MLKPKSILFLAATRFEGESVVRNVLNLQQNFWLRRSAYHLFSYQTQDLEVSVLVTGMGEATRHGLLSFLQDHRQPIHVAIGTGLCGGLSKSLHTGDIVCPTEVSYQGKSLEDVSNVLRDELIQAYKNEANSFQKLFTSPQVIDHPAAKAAIYAATGYEAIDMESHHWLEICREKNIPCAVIRSVLDTAQDHLPMELSQAVDTHGQPYFGKMTKMVFQQPSLI